jgi:ATP-dependent RNA helicase DeaD
VGGFLSKFLSLGISSALTEKLQGYGVANPTPVQQQAIPFIMDGKDIIAQAQTGTGKTFAFVLPILEKLKRNGDQIQALIVTPTRELALQITDEIEKLIHDLEDVHVLAVYGGQDVDKQLRKLKNKPQIVVGTPGRLLDHIRRETIRLANVSFLVLDEADQMLHIGFLSEVEEIIKETPKQRQTMLFSATIPDEVRKLANKYMRNPEYIQIEKVQGPADNVKQIAIHTVDRAKQGTLIQLIETHRPFLAVIFCRTKRRVSKLYEVLKAIGFSCDELHGDLSQAKREQVMKRFRDAEIQLLIATDVAARGLDVEGVTHVFNYDIPQDSESYVHRIGRTGRAGMKGLAITLYSSADRPTLDTIEKELNIRIQKQNLGNANKETGQERDSSARGETQKQTARKKPESQKKSNRGDRKPQGKAGDKRAGTQQTKSRSTKQSFAKGKPTPKSSEKRKSTPNSNSRRKQR